MPIFARKAVKLCVTVCFIGVATGLLVEIMYRIHLSRIVAAEVDERVHKTIKPDVPMYNVWATSPWKFDKDQGFKYTRGPWRSAYVRDGAFDHCELANVGNSFGNVDRPANYIDADIRIMIVGSSFSLKGDDQGRLVGDVLMDRLREHLGRPVSVGNFSRDSTGVLSYVDTARANVDQFKPNIIIMLVNTVALTYQRHWRTVLPYGNGFGRLYFSLDPVESLGDPMRVVGQSHLVYDRITKEWCDRMTEAKSRNEAGTLANDPLIKAIVAQRQRMVADAVTPRVTVNFWSPTVSFVANVLSSGDPFKGASIFGDQPIYSPLTWTRYSDDARFRAAVEYIRARKIPVILVHLPTLPEVQSAGGDFEPAGNRASLIADLEEAFGERFINIYQYYPEEYKSSPSQLYLSDVDFHPSPLGVALMGTALETALMKHKATASLLRKSAAHGEATAHEAAGSAVSGFEQE